MHNVFMLMRYLPFWAIGLAIAFLQAGVYLRRRESRAQWGCFAFAGILILVAGGWLFYRGDRFSDRWVRSIASEKTNS